MKKVFTYVITALMTAILVTSVAWAQKKDDRTPEEKAVDFRRGLLETVSWKLGQVARSAGGGDKAAFQKHAKDLSYLTTMITEGFIPNSVVGNSKAKKEIWEDWDDFVERAETLQTAARGLTASGYDISGFDPREFGKNCGNCHRKYKEKD